MYVTSSHSSQKLLTFQSALAYLARAQIPVSLQHLQFQREAVSRPADFHVAGSLQWNFYLRLQLLHTENLHIGASSSVPRQQLTGQAEAPSEGAWPPVCNYPTPPWYPQQPFSGANAIKMRVPPAVPVWLVRTAVTFVHCPHAWSLHSFGWEGCSSCSQGVRQVWHFQPLAGDMWSGTPWLLVKSATFPKCERCDRILYKGKYKMVMCVIVVGNLWGQIFLCVGSEGTAIRQVRFGPLWEMDVLRSLWRYQSYDVLWPNYWLTAEKRSSVQWNVHYFQPLESNYYYKWAEKQLIVTAP